MGKQRKLSITQRISEKINTVSLAKLITYQVTEDVSSYSMFSGKRMIGEILSDALLAYWQVETFLFLFLHFFSLIEYGKISKIKTFRGRLLLCLIKGNAPHIKSWLVNESFIKVIISALGKVRETQFNFRNYSFI